MRRKVEFPSKWLMIGAMAIFLGTSSIVIMLNSATFGYGLDISESISHYVGLEVWSSIFFVLANIFVAILIGRYLWRMGLAWRMPKIFFLFVLVMAASLIGLSLCPSGMFDVDPERPSIVTWMHILTSRTMFVMMMLIPAMVVSCRRATKISHAVNVLYLMYAVFCVVGFISEDAWFMNGVMIYEALYLFSFMVAMASCDERKENFDEFMIE